MRKSWALNMSCYLLFHFYRRSIHQKTERTIPNRLVPAKLDAVKEIQFTLCREFISPWSQFILTTYCYWDKSNVDSCASPEAGRFRSNKIFQMCLQSCERYIYSLSALIKVFHLHIRFLQPIRFHLWICQISVRQNHSNEYYYSHPSSLLRLTVRSVWWILNVTNMD